MALSMVSQQRFRGTLAGKNQAGEACLNTGLRLLHRGFRCVSNPLDFARGRFTRAPGTSEFHLEFLKVALRQATAPGLQI